tara:strand:+ start:1242 stop:1940 length:699 start_codon:yes stop_codon:yes gene_type:complete
MATFGQMLARYQASQRLGQQLSKSELGIAGEEEKQDIRRARSDYQTQLEQEQARLRKDAKKRGIRKLAAKGLTIGASLIPGVGKLASAAIGAGLDYAASESVGNYKGFIKGTLGEGIFERGAREDYDADLTETNRFFQEAYDSQKTANLVSALTSGMGQFGQYDTIKGIVDEVPGTRLIDKLSGGDKFVMPESPDLKDFLSDFELSFSDESSLLQKFGEYGTIGQIGQSTSF